MWPANNFQKLHLALSKILVRTTDLEQTIKMIKKPYFSEKNLKHW